MSTLALIVVNGQADNYAARFNGGKLECRTGTKPATPETAAAGTLIASITLANPAFPSAVNGQVVMNATPSGGTAVAAGTITWGRFYNSSNGALEDVTITEAGGGGNLIITQATLAISDPVDISSFSHTVPTE